MLLGVTQLQFSCAWLSCFGVTTASHGDARKGSQPPQARDLEGGREVLAAVSPWLSLLLFSPQAGGL